MKIKHITTLCKRDQTVYLYDGSDGQQYVGDGADGLTSFSVLRGRPGTTAWSSMQFTEQQLGRDVFLTREAALAALEGVENVGV